MKLICELGLILLLTTLVSYNVCGQQYRLDYQVTSNANSPYPPNNNNVMTVELRGTPGTVYLTNTGQPFGIGNYSGSYTITQRPTVLEVKTYQYNGSGVLVCNNTHTLNLSSDPQFTLTCEAQMIHWSCNTNFTIYIQFYPMITISGDMPGDYCNDDAIDLTASSGFGTYEWQYWTSGSGWQTFTTGGNAVSINSGTLGIALGTTFYIRSRSNSCDPYTSPAEWQRGPFRFKPYAVTLAGYAPTKPTCAGGSDGALDFTSLSRGLESGEQVAVTLYEANDISSDVVANGGSGSPLPASITGLTAGTYYALIESNITPCNSATLVPVTIGAGPRTPLGGSSAITSNHNGRDISCIGSTNGQITVTPSGGGGTYTYSLDGTNFQSSNVFTVGAGTYSIITIKDNCPAPYTNTIVTNQVIVNSPPAISPGTLTPSYCNGASNGQITVTDASGGTGTLTYSRDGTNFQASNVFSGLTSGVTYTITVRDANMCTASANVYVPAPVSTGTLSHTEPLCNGAADGSITVPSASGGTGPYTYSRNGTTFQPSNVFNGLAAGTYTITVRDSQGCTATANRTLTNPTVITGSLTTVHITCFGLANGSITVNASGGTGTLMYSRTGINGTYQAGNVFSGLTAGSYTIHVKDQNTCILVLNTTINQPTQLTASPQTITHVACNGASTGSITVSAGGGVAPLSYSRNGTTFQASNIFSGLTAGSYTITVRDQNSCSTTFNTTINQPSAMTASASSVTHVSCNGGNNGGITISAGGGVPSYSYSLNGGAYQSSNIFSGLTANNHTVTVRDQNSCTYPVNVTINQPSAVSASASSISHVTCNGGNNGSVTVSASGGTPTHFYSKDNVAFQSNSTLTGFSAGTHTIYVKDQNNCPTGSTSFTVTINQPVAITATATPTAPNCFGGTNGSISISASNGVLPFSYSLDGGPFQPSNVFSGLAADDYVVTIRDANLCSITRNVTVTQPSAVTGSIAVSAPVNCNGQSNGALNLTPSGGTSPYTFSWSNGATTEDITGLAAGSYSVVVTDSKGCQGTVNYTLTQPAVLVISRVLSNYNGSPISCNGASNGSINATVSGGTSPYSYAWSNGSTTEDISGLTAGTYTLTVTDNRGCITSLPITLTQPQPVSASISSQSNVLCFGGNNGSVTVSAAGGTGSYSYSINGGSTWQAGATFPNLTAGSYTITTRDVNNCTGTTPVTITSPAALVVNLVSKQDTQCGQSNGSAQVSGTGGVAAYTYRWRNSSSVIIGNAASISNLVSGSYTAEIIDQNGCLASLPVTINSSNGPTVTVTSMTPATCSDRSDGAATISISGGTSPYTVLWPNGQTTLTATNLSPSTHMVQVTDNTGCAGLFPVTITSPSALNIQSTTLQNPACAGNSNGIIEVSVTGGTNPYTLLWSSGQTTNRIENRNAGNYTVTVTDNKGCQGSKLFTLTDPPVLTVQTISSVNPSCSGSNNGSIQVAGNGGNGSYTYLWNGGQTTSQISNLVAGQYTVTVTDQLGCQASKQTTLIDPQALVVQSTNVQHPSCLGLTNGSIQVSATGGNGTYVYQWSTGATGNTLSGIGAGTYTATVTDILGCTNSINVTLNNPPALTVSTVSTQNPNCGGASNGSIQVAANGGTAPYTFQWNNGATGSSVNNFIAGTHTVTVTDQKGCTASLGVTLTQPPPLVLQVVNTQNPICFGAANGFIETASSGGTGTRTFLWNTGSTSNLLNGVTAGTYSLTVTDQNGCSTTSQFTLTNPEQLKLDLGQDRTICPGQSATVNPDVTNVSFQWSGPNGFTSTSQQITTSQPGIYSLRITDAKGCQAEDNFQLTISDQLLKADLLMVSQAHVNDTIIVIDISWPAPQAITWNFGTQATILYQGQDYALLTYAEPGFYTVTVDALLAGCQNSYTQGIQILEAKDPDGGRVAQNESAIIEYTVHPNPFREAFELSVSMSRSAPLTVQMLHLGTNMTVFQDDLEESHYHQKEYQFGNLAAGVYVLLIKSGKEIKSVRLLRL